MKLQDIYLHYMIAPMYDSGGTSDPEYKRISLAVMGALFGFFICEPQLRPGGQEAL